MSNMIDQREWEADYRDLSEATNSRAVWYSVAQIVVLLVTCTWQLRHLKVGNIWSFLLDTNNSVTSVSLKIEKCVNISVLLSYRAF